MRYIYLVLAVFFITGCSNSSNLEVSSFLQTQNAKLIKQHYKDINKLLLEYKTKLDIRNPNSYDKNLDKHLKKNIQKSNNINLYSKKHKKFNYYHEYLNYAFSNENVKNRNDYLIIGIYKMFYKIYNMRSKHKLTALNYDLKEFQKAYKNLQILNWKIKTKKDTNNNYMFLTWQNNWQIEYLQRLNNNKSYTFNSIDLKNISQKKESLLDPSNTSFEIIIHSMLLYLKQSILILGAQPEELAIESILSIAFLI